MNATTVNRDGSFEDHMTVPEAFSRALARREVRAVFVGEATFSMPPVCEHGSPQACPAQRKFRKSLS